MSETPAPILVIVDDDALVLAATTRRLRGRGFRVIGTSSPLGVIDLVLRIRPDAVVLDFHMPNLDGAEVARALRAAEANMPILFFSGANDERLLEVHAATPHSAIVQKGQDPAALVARLRTFGVRPPPPPEPGSVDKPAAVTPPPRDPDRS